MPSRYSKLMQEILDSMFEGFVLDENKKLKVVNEDAAKATAEKIHKLVLEKSRDLWDQFESADAELRSAAAEINFEELNADVSNLGRGEADEVSIHDLTNMDTEGVQTLESKDLKKVLGTEDFDLKTIFEGDDWFPTDDGDGGDRKLTDEGEGAPMMDAGDDENELDGDKEFDQDMDDESDVVGDMEPDEYNDKPAGDEIEIEPEDELGGEEPLDDLGGDDLGMDDELNGEEPLDDLGVEGDLEGEGFDFSDLGDLGLGDEDDVDEMMGGYRMESEGDDDDKDDKDDDKDDDDKDDKDDDKPAFLKKDGDDD